ncbi:MAG: NUDIX domain-containing protein, partial [Planctomycetes bacterium]|nr:NUDIX domain-containing protein [Planctomycetota bacterium]
EVIFGTETTILRSETKELLNLFEKRGEFKPRKDVEADPDLVQALPAVVVRTKNGDVLRLRRREKSKSNSLDKELVIWAGGHVRKEDSKNGNTITQCATRELQEELRLSVEAHELRILGAIYVDTGGSTSKHVAIVYEWRARTDDVVVTLSKTEFFERRGTSLSGKFVSLNDLLDEVKNKKLSEPWSIEIVEKLLPVSSENKLQGLF